MMHKNYITRKNMVEKEEYEYTYSGFENAETAKHLREGETCKVTGIGNSMTPILKSRQPVICIPMTEETELKKRDIVMCKVNGHFLSTLDMVSETRKE